MTQELRNTDNESQECDLISEQIGKLDNENVSMVDGELLMDGSQQDRCVSSANAILC